MSDGGRQWCGCQTIHAVHSGGGSGSTARLLAISCHVVSSLDRAISSLQNNDTFRHQLFSRQTLYPLSRPQHQPAISTDMAVRVLATKLLLLGHPCRHCFKRDMLLVRCPRKINRFKSASLCYKRRFYATMQRAYSKQRQEKASKHAS